MAFQQFNTNFYIYCALSIVNEIIDLPRGDYHKEINNVDRNLLNFREAMISCSEALLS